MNLSLLSSANKVKKEKNTLRNIGNINETKSTADWQLYTKKKRKKAI